MTGTLVWEVDTAFKRQLRDSLPKRWSTERVSANNVEQACRKALANNKGVRGLTVASVKLLFPLD